MVVSIVVSHSFEDTMTTTMTEPDFKKVIVVMLLYGVMWAAGLAGIALCSVRHHYKEAHSKKNSVTLKMQIASSTRSPEDMRRYLTAYGALDFVLPLALSFSAAQSLRCFQVCFERREA